MKNNITELVFILDRSGSMSGMEEDTVGGFNAMLEKQKKLDGKAYVSTVLFSNTSEVLHDRKSIDKVLPLTKNDYCVGGGTALLDAIGGAIHHIGNIHKYARIEDVPEHTMFVITTDGMENASHMYSANDVRNMIKQEEEKNGWEFIFVAANIDAVKTAETIGIRRERAANYNYSGKGTKCMYEAVEYAVSEMRCGGSIDGKWKEKLGNEKNEK